MRTYSIKVRKEFLSKDACMEEARNIISEGMISGMSEPLRWVKKYADPIDMRDGGDKPLRRVVFAASWVMTGRKK